MAIDMEVVAVRPADTSQRCASCGPICADNRESQAVLRCRSYGHDANADVNAAKELPYRRAGGHSAWRTSREGPHEARAQPVTA